MTVLSGIAGGEPVAVIDFPTVSTAIVVTQTGRVRTARVAQLEILRGWFAPSSVGHALNEAKVEVKHRRTQARIERRGAA